MNTWIRSLLVVGMLVAPAFAGRELDNRSGMYNGNYRAANIKVRQPDQEDKEMKSVPIVLRERFVDIVTGEAQLEKARVDQIYTTGYKTEITAREIDGNKRYFIMIEGSIAR